MKAVIEYLMANKKWWIPPIIIVVLLTIYVIIYFTYAVEVGGNLYFMGWGAFD